jgi:hypothetical protein
MYHSLTLFVPDKSIIVSYSVFFDICNECEDISRNNEILLLPCQKNFMIVLVKLLHTKEKFTKFI